MTSTPAPLIAPSILASDFSRLAEECRAVIDAGADWLHVDVMDGHFVPNITIGLPVVGALRQALPDAFLDVHLMIAHPEFYAPRFAAAGADLVSFHPEATPHTHKVIQSIHAAGAKCGLAINPATPLDVVEYVLDDVDMILVMSVNPGFGGQAFIPATLQKLTDLSRLLERRGRTDLRVQVDGGISAANIASVAEAGANVFVAGSAIFGSDSYARTIAAMRDALEG